MMGTRSPQDKLFAADQVYLDYVGRDSLYGYLAQNRQHLFRDEDFASLYCLNNGRTSVAPSLAISLLLLRAVEGVSFVEAIERSKYDLRWKVALGLEMEEVAMQKSALQGVLRPSWSCWRWGQGCCRNRSRKRGAPAT